MRKQYTKMAQQVLELAQKESKKYKHGYVGTEHILLGLLATDSVAAKVLEKSDIQPKKVRSMIEELINPGNVAVMNKDSFSPRAKEF